MGKVPWRFRPVLPRGYRVLDSVHVIATPISTVRAEDKRMVTDVVYPNLISNALPFIFADGTKFLKSIASLLQEDIKTLESWYQKKMVHPDKNVILRFSLSREDCSHSPYSIHGQQIPFSKQHVDLGISVNSNLSWSRH